MDFVGARRRVSGFVQTQLTRTPPTESAGFFVALIQRLVAIVTPRDLDAHKLQPALAGGALGLPGVHPRID
ncbi:MAG TPA: hypothetical protein VL282_04055 [Tepidisphaeraceae bacterium]|jgi:hypothetical protein|nr:hypothetical protein [Tepidisphaeraceae bacterium]